MSRRFFAAGVFLGAATGVALSAALLQHDSPSDSKLAEADLKAVAAAALLYAMDTDDRLPSNARQIVDIGAYIKRYALFLPFAKDRIAVTYSGPNLADGGAEMSIKSAIIF